MHLLLTLVMNLPVLSATAAEAGTYWQVSCGDRFNDRSGVLDIELRWFPQPLPVGLLADERRGLRVDADGIDLEFPDRRIAWGDIGALEFRPANRQSDAKVLTLVLPGSGREERVTVGVLELRCWRDVEALVKRYATRTEIVGLPSLPEVIYEK